MKTIIQLCLYLLIPVFLTGKIIETSEFEEILSHVNGEKVLVVCDIDNTIIRSKGHFGGVAWGDHLIRQLKAQGFSDQEILKFESEFWILIKEHVETEIIDPNTSSVLNELKNCNHLIMALTARCAYDAEHTHGQLAFNEISFSKDSLPSRRWFVEDADILYENGVLFTTAKVKKSKVLFDFLDHYGIAPDQIIFIDDKLHHVEDLMHECLARGISYIGVRFSGADTHVENFNSLIADQEWEAITNENAQRLRLTFNKMMKEKKEL